MTKRYVILGNGIAGQTCAEDLRKADADASITIIAAERHPLYNRVALPRYLRGQVLRGITLPTLLRSYRLGHAWLWGRWTKALAERIDDPDELIAAQEASSEFMFAYIDRVCDALRRAGAERVIDLTTARLTVADAVVR